MAAELTYNSLLSDVLLYLEQVNGAVITAQLPRFVMLAENRCAVELKMLGFQEVVTDTLTLGSPILPKPAYWREMISLNLTLTTGARVELLPRVYEYCRNFWPNAAKLAQPRFYADYNYDNLLLAPTPDLAYPFEMVYYARLQPLDSTTQQTWLTRNAPQLLLYATLLEANLFLKNADKIAVWQTAFDRALAALTGEDRRRVAGDRTTGA